MISRAPRPWVAKLNDQRMTTSSRFWKPIEVPEVNEEPGGPGEEAAEPEALDVGHSGGTADRGEVPLVVVAERRGRLAAEARADDAAA